MRLRIWLGDGHWVIADANDITRVLERLPNVQLLVPSRLVLDGEGRGHLLCNGVVRRCDDVVRIERR